MNSCAGKRSRTHSWSLSGSKLLLVARREFGAVQLVATLTVVVATVLSWPSLAAAGETKNVILITMDGLRWQELFTGADQRLMTKDAGQVDQPEQLRQRYFRKSSVERRALLMPFFWNRIAKEGQVFGDPSQNASVRVTNGQFFSYPGYNELLCGFGDPAITSNDKNYNQNVTVLEWLELKPGFENRVAAFASWDVFPYIINTQRSGVYVNAGWQPLDVARDQKLLKAYNEVAANLPRYWSGVRYDAFTFRGATEYLQVKRPRVLYVSLGETDDWAHAGRYDLYLDAATKNDQFIRQLWEAAQQIDQYKDSTTLILTTDHGRGDGREGWKSHSATLPGSDRMWFAVMGPDTPATGLQKDVEITQSQTAATLASLLGYDFTSADKRIAPPVDGVSEPTQ